jgi:hypothetical protein
MFDKLLLYSEEHRSSDKKLIVLILGRHNYKPSLVWSAEFALEAITNKRTGKAMHSRRTYLYPETYSVVL